MRTKFDGLSLAQLLCLAAAVPALVIGALVMRQHAVPASRWVINLSGGTLGILACLFTFRKSRTPISKTTIGVMALACLGLIAATFAQAGSMGVHRWVRLGPLTLYVSAVCLPCVIIALGMFEAFGRKPNPWAVLFGLMIGALLLLQPDAAQALGLAAAALTLAILNKSKAPRAWIGVLAISAFAIWAWLRIDPLPPVEYVEGILGLARQSGQTWFLLSIATLIILPLPFFFYRAGPQSDIARAVGVYFCAYLVASFLRPFPVPLLGFGLSPIAGYFIALGVIGRSAARQ